MLHSPSGNYRFYAGDQVHFDTVEASREVWTNVTDMMRSNIAETSHQVLICWEFPQLRCTAGYRNLSILWCNRAVSVRRANVRAKSPVALGEVTEGGAAALEGLRDQLRYLSISTY